MVSLRAAALDYAARGWPVFPVSRSKQPLVKGWQHRASTDQMKVWLWWDRHPRASIGCATGHVFDVVDLDSPQARADYEQMALEVGHAFEGPISRTGRHGGGWQLFYEPTGFNNRDPYRLEGGRRVQLDGIDYRGLGGFVILPPSVHATGNVYTWLREPTGDWQALPEPMRTQLWPARPEPARQQVPPPRGIVGDARMVAWANAALDAILQELEGVPAGRGQRNNALNVAAFRAYQLAHILDQASITKTLASHPFVVGYGHDKGQARMLRTLDSARKGLESPRYPSTQGER